MQCIHQIQKEKNKNKIKISKFALIQAVNLNFRLVSELDLGAVLR
jgi:hypothetical protein